MSPAHLRQRLCWQGRMTTGLENTSRHTGQISCFSRFSMAPRRGAPDPELPVDGGLKPTAKFITSTEEEEEEEGRSVSSYPSVSLPAVYSLSCKVTLVSCSSLYPTAGLSNPPVETLPYPPASVPLQPLLFLARRQFVKA